MIWLSYLCSSSTWVSETTTRTDNAPPLPTRAVTVGWFWVNTQEYEEWDKKMAPLARALENNVANVETQAQAINPFRSHESSGVGEISLLYTRLLHFLLFIPQALNCWVLEHCSPFASAQRENERNRDGRRCELVGNYLKLMLLRMALGLYLQQTVSCKKYTNETIPNTSLQWWFYRGSHYNHRRAISQRRWPGPTQTQYTAGIKFIAKKYIYIIVAL